MLVEQASGADACTRIDCRILHGICLSQILSRMTIDMLCMTNIGFHLPAGLLFLLDVFINLHVGFVVRYDYKMKIIKDGRSVLWFYAFHGGMWMDVLSATPVVFEV